MKLSENLTVILSVVVVSGLLVAFSSFTGGNETTQQADSNSITSTAESQDTEPDASDSSDVPVELAALTPGEVVSIATALTALEVKPEEATESYDRKAFKHWSNAEGSDCDVRDAVLKEEADPAIAADADCPLPDRKWISLYDGKILTDPSKLDIDHMVPLAEAWRSGAHAWADNPDRLEAYANDMGDPRALIAVSAGSNRSKSDQDPDVWLPTSDDYLCTYLADWVAMKYRWELTLETSEYDAIAEKANGECSEEVLVVPEPGWVD